MFRVFRHIIFTMIIYCRCCSMPPAPPRRFSCDAIADIFRYAAAAMRGARARRSKTARDAREARELREMTRARSARCHVFAAARHYCG
jgi:hypothetical protein